MTVDNAFVTVSVGAGRAEVARASAIAIACGLPFRPRSARDEGAALVVEKQGAHLEIDGATTRSHPGIGLLRIKRLLAGEQFDLLVTLAGIRPGESVLDCTFGFGQDALTLACAVGAGGRVVGLEASPLLFGLALAGMPHWPEPARSIVPRIELLRADYRSFLPTLPDRSFDVVFFDPMFRKPKLAAPDFAVLRRLAEASPLDRSSLEEARRIARRIVVVKDAWPGREVGQLGLRAEGNAKRGDVVFGLDEAIWTREPPTGRV